MWNDFQKYVSGWGFSSDQIRDMYRQHRDEMRNRSDGEKPKETLFEAECKKRKSRPVDPSPPLQPQAYAGPSSSASTVFSPPHRVAGQDCFDLNRVTKEQLVTLDGIGPSTADAILSRRKELQSKGLCYMNVKDLLKVKYLGAKTFAKIEQRLFVVEAEVNRVAEGQELPGRTPRRS